MKINSMKTYTKTKINEGFTIKALKYTPKCKSLIIDFKNQKTKKNKSLVYFKNSRFLIGRISLILS